MSNLGQAVVNTFESLTPDLEGIYQSHKEKKLEEFTGAQSLSVIASGAVSGAIPGLHLVGAAADIAFLMNRMSVACYGIGAIKGHQAFSVNILEQEDFALILALWAGDDDVSKVVTNKVGADVLVVGGAKLAFKSISKGIGHQFGVITGKKLAGKVGAKVGAKIGAKAGAKFAAGWIPVLGGVVGAGVNAYFLSDIAEAGRKYYDFKVDFIRRHDLLGAAQVLTPQSLPEISRPTQGELPQPQSAHLNFLAQLEKAAQQRVEGEKVASAGAGESSIPESSPAWAEPVGASSQENTTPQARADYLDELQRLGDLRDKGILTQDEFTVLKAEVLRRAFAG